jgi:nucleotide-binding universal stress UspA family protein
MAFRRRFASVGTVENEAGTIVVGVDGSSESKAALRWALEETRLRRARLRCVHAWILPPLFDPSGLAAPYMGELRKSLAKDAKELLESAVAEVARDAGDVLVEMVEVEGPAGPGAGRDREGRRAAHRRLARARRLYRPAARLGQPAVRPPRRVPSRDRSLARERGLIDSRPPAERGDPAERA